MNPASTAAKALSVVFQCMQAEMAEQSKYLTANQPNIAEATLNDLKQKNFELQNDFSVLILKNCELENIVSDLRKSSVEQETRQKDLEEKLSDAKKQIIWLNEELKASVNNESLIFTSMEKKKLQEQVELMEKEKLQEQVELIELRKELDEMKSKLKLLEQEKANLSTNLQ